MSNKLPLLISRGIVVFPHQVAELDIGRVKSIAAISKAQALDANNPQIIISSQIDYQIDEPTSEQIYQVGTRCQIISVTSSGDGSLSLKVEGEKRVVIGAINIDAFESGEYFSADYDFLKERGGSSATNVAAAKRILKKIETNYAARSNHFKGESELLQTFSKSLNDVSKFTDIIAGYLASIKIELVKLQAILAEASISRRLAMVSELLDTYVFNSSFANESASKQADEEETTETEEPEPAFDKNAEDLRLTKKINENLSKQQREFYLRERLKIIREELGEISSRDDDISKLQQKIADKPYPKAIKERILSEINRYESTGSGQEGSIIRSYIE